MTGPTDQDVLIRQLQERPAGGGGGSIVAGKLYVPTDESISSTSYTKMPTPDSLPGIVVPTGGVLGVFFWGLVANNGATPNARTAIFLNNTQLLIPTAGANAVQEAPGNSLGGYAEVATVGGHGLETLTSQGTSIADLSGSGTILGGSGIGPSSICWIHVDPGTYEVSVRYKSVNAGQVVIARDRHLVAFVL